MEGGESEVFMYYSVGCPSLQPNQDENASPYNYKMASDTSSQKQPMPERICWRKDTERYIAEGSSVESTKDAVQDEPDIVHQDNGREVKQEQLRREA